MRNMAMLLAMVSLISGMAMAEVVWESNCSTLSGWNESSNAASEARATVDGSGNKFLNMEVVINNGPTETVDTRVASVPYAGTTLTTNAWVRDGVSFTFCVDDVSEVGHTYDFASNVITCNSILEFASKLVRACRPSKP